MFVGFCMIGVRDGNDAAALGIADFILSSFIKFIFLL